ncbi:MAG: TIR domain-containing protein [Candidatus Nitrosotenuis sp.]
MGGSGGSIDFSSRGSDAGEKIFKSATDEAERATQSRVQRNVFISFAVEDEAQVNLLRSQAKDDRFDFQFRDYSIKEPFDEAWKTQCKEIIALTSVVIVAIGETTADSEAVDWEIREAHRQGKKVVGMRIHKGADHRIPRALTEHGDKIIDWKADQLGDELQ